MMTIIGITLILMIVGAIIGARTGNKNDKTVTSSTLREELNEERKAQGKSSLPAINSGSTSTSTYARMDKSWRSVPDFFIQLVRGRRK